MKRIHIKFTMCLATLFFITLQIFGQGRADKEEWIQLFNGKDLHDWNVKISGYDLNDNYGNTFRVEDGKMKVSFDQYDKFDQRFGHIFYEDDYSYY